jgi:hypothetical protein
MLHLTTCATLQQTCLKATVQKAQSDADDYAIKTKYISAVQGTLH